MKKPFILTTALAFLVSGCATSSKNIGSAYVSPLQYQSYDCEQLGAEAARITQAAQQLGGRLDEAASNDAALMGVGLILFWPALFALGGNKAQEAEYSRLKGEADAVQRAAIAKKCPATLAPTMVASGESTAAETSAVSPDTATNTFPAGWSQSAQNACIQGAGHCPPGYKR